MFLDKYFLVCSDVKLEGLVTRVQELSMLVLDCFFLMNLSQVSMYMQIE